MNRKHYDVLVLGNGILGMSLVYELIQADPTLKIGIVGPAQRPASATTAAGAMLNCFAEVTTATFQSDYEKEKFNMATQAARLWPNWITGINESLPKQFHVNLHPNTFIIFNTQSGKQEDRNYYAIVKGLESQQEEYHEMDPTDVPGLNPVDDYRPYKTLLIPNEGYVDPKSLLIALENNLKQYKQVTIMDDTVTTISVDANKIKAVKTQSGLTLSAQHTVLAMGMHSQSIIDQIPVLKNRIPRLLAGVGVGLIINKKNHRINGVIRTPKRSGGCGTCIIPRSQHSLYLGASNFLTMFPHDKPKIRYLFYLFQYAMDQINQDLHDCEMEHIVIGNRPVSMDTFPLLGATSIDGLWLVTGTYRDGLHDAPWIAHLMAQEIVHNKRVLNPLFHPERPLISPYSIQESITAFAQQAMDAAYEHYINLPRNGWALLVHEAIPLKIEKLYQELDIDVGLPIEVLLMLSRCSEAEKHMIKQHLHTIRKEHLRPLLTA